MQKWGRKYPNAGYGGRFRSWLRAANPRPYGSYGNGSAMRVAAAGWLFDSLETIRHMARLTAEVTHNHPEGIKGAEATASAIFLARTGKTKDEIRDYMPYVYEPRINEAGQICAATVSFPVLRISLNFLWHYLLADHVIGKANEAQLGS